MKLVKCKTMKIITERTDMELPAPLAEPLINWYNDVFIVTRIRDNDEIVIYGYSINWKSVNGKWYRLGVDNSIKPLSEYLPDIIYPVERNIWIECPTPLYEQIYQKLKREND